MDPTEGSWATIKEATADALELPALERPPFLDRVARLEIGGAPAGTCRARQCQHGRSS